VPSQLGVDYNTALLETIAREIGAGGRLELKEPQPAQPIAGMYRRSSRSAIATPFASN
jgi:hypothetical protein